MSNNTQPEIRFPGFTEDWEQRKAKELFIPKAEKNQPELPVLSVTQDHGVVYREQVGIDIKYDKATLKNYKVIHQGDFVISLRSFQGGFELSDKLGITSPAYTIFVPKNMDSQDNLFWKTKFKTFTFIESLKTVTFGIRDGKSISFSEFGDLKLFFPKNIEEQQKIGAFFKQLDDTIALHQRKLDLLKETKKGFLQKMFPKNGAKVPEIRFPGFTEDWEERKLVDIFKKDTQKNKDLEFHSDSVISVAKMKLSPPSAKSSDEYMKTYNKIRKGNVAFEGHTNDEFPNGRFVLNDCQDGIVSHIYDVYSAVDEYNNEFMKRYINNPDVMRKILINATSSARMMKSLNSIEFLKQSILLPILSEQQKIGKFFYQLDNTITLHQRKLDLLKETKKGFLQKMFV